jgi:hemerythrin
MVHSLRVLKVNTYSPDRNPDTFRIGPVMDVQHREHQGPESLGKMSSTREMRHASSTFLIHSQSNTMPTTSTAPNDDFTWSDEYLLGFDAIDAVHEEFVQVVHQLLHSKDENLLAHLDEFAAHAKSHFDTEDQWMRETAFPPAQCHIDEHAAVMQSLQEVRQRVVLGDYDVGRSFTRELVKWFPGHATHLDSALAQWMFKREHGGKPVVFRRQAASSQKAFGL